MPKSGGVTVDPVNVAVSPQAVLPVDLVKGVMVQRHQGVTVVKVQPMLVGVALIECRANL